MIPFWVYAYVILLMAATMFTAGYCIGRHAAGQKPAKEGSEGYADHRKLHED